MPRAVLCLPTYNERENLEQMIEALGSVLDTTNGRERRRKETPLLWLVADPGCERLQDLLLALRSHAREVA